MKTVLKVILPLFALIFLFTQCKKEPKNDPVDEVKIKDGNFYWTLLDAGVDTDGDGLISSGEAAALQELYLYNKGISDLSGIEAFTSLVVLQCSNNNLSSLDVSKNTELELLECFNNNIITLDVSNNPQLRRINCSQNQIEHLDVSNVPLLAYLMCEINQLKHLDFSNNSHLAGLDCRKNQITSLDFTHNTDLDWLICPENQLTSLQISKNTSLYELECDGNQLTSLDISKNTSLGVPGPLEQGLGTYLSLKDMPSLQEVCVWTLPFPPEYLGVDTTGSPNVFFTMDCSK